MKRTFALNTCTKSEEMKRSNTTEPFFRQVNRGAEAFYCITKANTVVHRVLFRFRSMISADMIMLVRGGIAAKIDDRSCSPAIISINAEKTQPLKKNKQQETRQETISHFCS